MKKHLFLLFIVLVFFNTIKVIGQAHPHLTAGTTYYISSSSGNDNNSGTSQYSPWKTTNKISYWGNSIVNLAGTKILFKRGDVWNDTGLIIKNMHGNLHSSLEIGAYGSGNKPVISGKSEITNVFYKLEDSSGNQIQDLWYCEMERDPGRVFGKNPLNNAERELMKGYDVKFHRTHIGTGTIGANFENSFNRNLYDLGQPPYSLINNCASPISALKNEWYWLASGSEFWYDNCTSCNGTNEGDHPLETINISSNRLIIYSTTDPNNTIYYKATNTGGWKSPMNIQIFQSSNILIQDIDFKGGKNCFAIGNMGYNVPDSNDVCKNIEIMNCNIGKYSESAFEIRNVENIRIHDNHIDSGYNINVGLSETNCKGTVYQMGQTPISNNLSYWFSGSDRGTGDAIELSNYAKDCKIYNNTFLNWGHSAVQLGTWQYDTEPYGDWDVSGNKVYNNTIDDSAISYGRAFNIYGTQTTNNEFYNNTILKTTIRSQISGVNNSFHHNIFDGVTQSDLRPKGYASAISVSPVQPGIECNNNRFDNNTFIDCEDGGIKIACPNSGPSYTYLPVHHNYFRNNILYNCGRINSAAIIIQSDGFNISNGNVNNNRYFNNSIFNDNGSIEDVLYFNQSLSIYDFNAENEGIYSDIISNNIYTNPNFIDLSSSYQLDNNSPIRNVGDISVILDEDGNILDDFNRFDYYNVTFPNQAPDIGAQEVNPTVTSVSNNDCNRVLTADNTIIYFYPILDNTEGYTVKLIDSANNYLEFFVNNDNSFDLSDYYHLELSNNEFLKPHTWYIIRIKKGYFSSNDYSNYGGNCNIRTPRYTFLTEDYCNNGTFIQIDDYIECYSLPNSTNYKFRFTNSYGTYYWIDNNTPKVRIPNIDYFRVGGNYQVEARSSGPYGDVCNIHIPPFEPFDPYSIEKNKYSTSAVYPNPVNNILYLPQNIVYLKVFISDMQGKIIFNENNYKQNYLNLEYLSAGPYILTIQDSENIVNHYKFIKD